jgi:LAGLIDADG DNA endonuclease family protein
MTIPAPASSEFTVESFMSRMPASLPGGNTDWAQRYGHELRTIIVRQARRQPRNLQTTLGPSELGQECLAGETEVVTRQGIRKIRDLAKDGYAELLIPRTYGGHSVLGNPGRTRWGTFRRVPVECFGEQELFEITLRRSQETKVVFATAEHRWFRSYWSRVAGNQVKQQSILETCGLRPGYRLTQLRRAMSRSTTLMPVAIAQGFVFGDGTKGGDSGGKHRPATLNLYRNGKDEALLPFFPGEHRTYRSASHAPAFSLITGLPRFWKRLPPIDESVSFLLSWLAGYFAADGSVGNDGHCTISSAFEENLLFVRDVAAICGVGYGQIRRKMRIGISGTRPARHATPLYELSLRRRDLPEWFFLTRQHAERARAASLAPEHDPHWIVESVRATGRTEPVYCAITGEAGAFALADDLMTGNCPRAVVWKMAGIAGTNNVIDPWPSVVGTAVHAWLATAFERENQIDGWIRWVPEARVAPTPDHPGNCDIYDVVNRCTVDWKGLFVHTPVPTPDGWTTLGQLQVGDTVFSASGHSCTVTKVYPVQYRDCYRITFKDGSCLITDDVQELPFVISGRRPLSMAMSTAEASRKVWSSRPQRQLRVYNGTALELPELNLTVHPYVLGCWLGDGGVHGGTISIDSRDADDLVSQIQACGYKTSSPHGQRGLVRTIYGLSTQLRRLGLQWVDQEHQGRSHNRLAGVKRIPAEYLRGSQDQRLALLQGLMDTDGTWNQVRNQAVFSSTDKQLAQDTAELIRSLGWKARVMPVQSRGFGLTVTEYYVAFTPFGANPFRLQRKASLVRLAGTVHSRYRLVRQIEPVLSVPTRCIDVDSPDHLYLAGTEMIPVHNCLGPTTLALIKRPEGPPRRYVVQLLLYALGFRNLGLPVERVVLAALPRTAPTLASMYVWEHVITPADDLLIGQVLAETRIRYQVAQAILRREISPDVVPYVPGATTCQFCRYFRPQAAREIRETGHAEGPGCPGHSPTVP